MNITRISKHILSVLTLVGIASFSMSASASMCGVTMNTDWSGQIGISSDTSMVGCTTSSSYVGQRDGFDMDSFTYTVDAIDDDTFALSLTVTDAGSGPAFTGDVDLVISNISWGATAGTIVGIVDNMTDGGGGSSHSINFTGDSISISMFQGDSCSPPFCTFNIDLGTIDLIVDHAAAVPEPSSLALLGIGMVGFAIARRKRLI